MLVKASKESKRGKGKEERKSEKEKKREKEKKEREKKGDRGGEGNVGLPSAFRRVSKAPIVDQRVHPPLRTLLSFF